MLRRIEVFLSIYYIDISYKYKNYIICLYLIYYILYTYIYIEISYIYICIYYMSCMFIYHIYLYKSHISGESEEFIQTFSLLLFFFDIKNIYTYMYTYLHSVIHICIEIYIYILTNWNKLMYPNCHVNFNTRLSTPKSVGGEGCRPKKSELQNLSCDLFIIIIIMAIFTSWWLNQPL